MQPFIQIFLKILFSFILFQQNRRIPLTEIRRLMVIFQNQAQLSPSFISTDSPVMMVGLCTTMSKWPAAL